MPREAQLAIIRKYAADRNLFAKIRKLCTRWSAVAGVQKGKTRWRTTDSIEKWDAVEQHDMKLLCATVVQPVYIDEWGALNAICVLLPNLAPANTNTAGSNVANKGVAILQLRRRARSHRRHSQQSR
ncbi:hypothetical protein PsorP6_001267 [Peronosclerospora sorghi]|uniref:Uncharacterized protein n=1 Tax=Peronosclerospora sorghi TaxID=230839 RepID=A0ACC0WT48_9STRA|nr:hypothetical protein PsorP6_001267 [Peronosclerospora sorghi]